MALLSNPPEILKLIASELPDIDLCNFCLVCRRFNSAVQDDQVVWRAKFLSIYDEPSSRVSGKPYDWKRVYQLRQRIILRGVPPTEFGTGNLSEETLEVIWDVLHDAQGYKSATKEISGKNLNILDGLKRQNRTLGLLEGRGNNYALAAAVNVLTTPLLQLPEEKDLYGLHTMVYSTPAVSFDGYPQFQVIAALAKYFIYHIHEDSESDMLYQKRLMQPHEYPSWWEGKLSDYVGPCHKIPSKWYGAYAYAQRTIRPQLRDFSDGPLMDVSLSMTSHNEFQGSGCDIETFTITHGKISSTKPDPTLRYSGAWKHIEFRKSYHSHQWTYEGAMLPGNNMILGHWRRPGTLNSPENFRGNNGPFVLWAVPEGSTIAGRNDRLGLPS
ncbi:hypothetical protein C7212DRAFT_352799 [Tuber magnatum]|uniref:F-box domain-containing protein n=1 Tax=Tuber magnatum TaxID=42249 RepID=A0A317SNI9_9PEZI|nr:hypothetical protein C7212DRAFT_352799 [Tuber magnatum]